MTTAIIVSILVLLIGSVIMVVSHGKKLRVTRLVNRGVAIYSSQHQIGYESKKAKECIDQIAGIIGVEPKYIRLTDAFVGDLALPKGFSIIDEWEEFIKGRDCRTVEDYIRLEVEEMGEK